MTDPGIRWIQRFNNFKGVGAVASLRQVKQSPKVGELTMQCPHCAHPDSIRYGTSRVSNATVAKPADKSFKHYDAAKIQSSSNRPVSSISKGWSCERSAGFSASITGWSLAGWSKLPSHTQQAHHRTKPAPSSKSMNSARSSLKKSQC